MLTVSTPCRPFADVPPTPRGHLGLLFYEATYALIYHLRCRAGATEKRIDSVFEQFPFLYMYFQEFRSELPDELVWDDVFPWFRAEIEQWESTVHAWLPLRALRSSE